MQIREEIFDYPLDESGRHFVWVCRRFGSIGLEDFVVVYYILADGRNIPLVTYDLAHGFAHRDLRFLSLGDRNRKIPMHGTSLSEVLGNALADVHANWEKYFEKYLIEKRRVLDENK